MSELSASDDNLILPENNSNKRLIKKRTFPGDTSSEEGIYNCTLNGLIRNDSYANITMYKHLDGRKRSKMLPMPSNYVPQMKREYSIKSQSKSISKPIPLLPLSQVSFLYT